MFTRKFAAWEKFSVRVVLVISLVIGIALTYWAGCYSNVFPEDYSRECGRGVKDFFIGNILAFLVWCAICMFFWRLLSKLDSERQNKWLHRTAIALLIPVCAILVVWLNTSTYIPMYDQEYVYTSVLEMIQGDYECMARGEHMFFYPYQLDVAFVFQVLFKLFGSVDIAVIQYVNIFSVLVTLYFGYLIVREISKNPAAQICYLMLGYTFVPLFMYVPYVYGEVIAIGASGVAIWAAIKWCRCQKKRYAVLLLFDIILACLLRKNAYIIMVAIAIGLLYYLVKNKCWKSLVLFVLCIVVPTGASGLVKGYYVKQSGYEISRGLPLAYRISSAMQESDFGAGGYNFDLLIEFYAYEFDYDAFEIHHKEMIKERLKDFLNNPETIPDFYRRKIMEQWNEHTFFSAYSMARAEHERVGLEYSILYGDIKHATDRYMNYYLFVLYLGLAISTLVFWRRRTEVYILIPLIVLIGGFLFSLIWEAQSRYVLPYVVIIQPFAAVGIGALVTNLWEKCSTKMQKRKSAD